MPLSVCNMSAANWTPATAISIIYITKTNGYPFVSFPLSSGIILANPAPAIFTESVGASHEASRFSQIRLGTGRGRHGAGTGDLVGCQGRCPLRDAFDRLRRRPQQSRH